MSREEKQEQRKGSDGHPPVLREATSTRPPLKGSRSGQIRAHGTAYHHLVTVSFHSLNHSCQRFTGNRSGSGTTNPFPKFIGERRVFGFSGIFTIITLQLSLSPSLPHSISRQFQFRAFLLLFPPPLSTTQTPLLETSNTHCSTRTEM